MRLITKLTLGAAAAVAFSVPAATPASAACGYPVTAIMYDGTSCTGTYVSLYKTDVVHNLGNLNFNDKASSAAAGSCQTGIRMFTNYNETGSNQLVGQNNYASVLNNGISNEVSSARTNAAAC